MSEKTFLQELLEKRATVTSIGETTNTDVSSALKEVDRQIRQCLTGGDVVRGEGVTKSGEEN